MNLNKIRLAGTVKAISIAMGLFLIGTTIIAIFPILVYGKLRMETPSASGRHFISLIALAIPVVLPYLALTTLKKRIDLGSDHPENAIGGLAIGLSSVLWLTVAMLSAGEYERPEGFHRITFAFCAFAPALVAMVLGGVAALLFLKNNRSILLVVASPFVAALSFLLVSVTHKAAPTGTTHSPSLRELRENDLRAIQIEPKDKFHPTGPDVDPE